MKSGDLVYVGGKVGIILEVCLDAAKLNEGARVYFADSQSTLWVNDFYLREVEE